MALAIRVMPLSWMITFFACVIAVSSSGNMPPVIIVITAAIKKCGKVITKHGPTPGSDYR
jgi:hypothetical protein